MSSRKAEWPTRGGWPTGDAWWLAYRRHVVVDLQVTSGGWPFMPEWQGEKERRATSFNAGGGWQGEKERATSFLAAASCSDGYDCVISE